MSDCASGQQAFADLLEVYRDPAAAAALSLARWDPLLRLARRAGVLGRLYARIGALEGALVALPAPVLGHLVAASRFSEHRHQLLRLELDALRRALPPEVQVVLLKGGAYLLAQDAAARGRLPSDVDILVRRAQLDTAERALCAAGWSNDALDPHDERYYREWSHELPPLRRKGQPLEVDLHHAITPVTGRIRPDMDAILEAVVPIDGSRWWVLAPLDRIVHAAIHVFQDSDLSDGLRHLLDLAALLDEHVVQTQAWSALVARAKLHGAIDPVTHALHFCRIWFGLPVPQPLVIPPAAGGVRLARWVFAELAVPRLVGQRPRARRHVAGFLGLARYHLMRMPPGLLVNHLANKCMRRLTRRRHG